MNIVEKFWSKHIVGNAKRCKTKAELLNKIKWRFDLYPDYAVLMGLYDNFEKKRILDFGCGVGWDLSWIALTDMPSRIVGIDVSKKALDIAHHHLGLARRHDARFILCSDTVQSVDTIGEYDIIISSGDCELMTSNTLTITVSSSRRDGDCMHGRRIRSSPVSIHHCRRELTRDGRSHAFPLTRLVLTRTMQGSSQQTDVLRLPKEET